MPIEHDIERVFDAGRAGASGIESQKSHLQSKIHVGVVPQHAIEKRFAVAGLADNAVGGALTHFHPVSLRVDEIELVFLVAFQLPSNQRVEVEDQPGFIERSLIFLGHAANLSRKHVDGFEELIEGLIAIPNSFVEISDGLVAYGT